MAIPVIFDTDIGSDIDDTWALAMLLKSHELDTRLIVSDRDNTVYRTKLICKMLEAAGCANIPVGVGYIQEERSTSARQAKWVEGYDLESYPGTLHSDGVDAIIQAIMRSDDPLTLICVGPVPNISEALRREPGIAERTHFVGMHGSIRRSRRGEGAIQEANVKNDVPACQAVFSAPWKSMTITPQDTCGFVQLTGERYQSIQQSDDPTLKALMENYEIWAQKTAHDSKNASSILFDTVAIYLAFATEHLAMERMGIRVTDDGFTVRDNSARQMNVALEWQHLNAFHDFLTHRLLSEIAQA